MKRLSDPIANLRSNIILIAIRETRTLKKKFGKSMPRMKCSVIPKPGNLTNGFGLGAMAGNRILPLRNPPETIDPGVVLEAMEKKLWEEGRVEIFRKLMSALSLVKQELANIRKATVAKLGYDKFHEEIVKIYAKHAIDEIITPEMEERKERLIDVALHMMLSQGVDGRGGPEGEEWVRRQLAAAFRRGRVDGYCEACELLYVRR